MIFVLRGSTNYLSCLFKSSAGNTPMSPVEATVRIVRYVDNAVTDVISTTEMTYSGYTGRFHYRWDVSAELPPYTVCYIEFKGLDSDDNDLSLEDAATVLDFGGFGGGLRAFSST